MQQMTNASWRKGARGWMALFVFTAFGCGQGDGDTGSGAAGGGALPQADKLTCPSPGALPFRTDATGFSDETNSQNVAALSRFKDEASDLLGQTDGPSGYTSMPLDDAPSKGLVTFAGRKARTGPKTGLISTAIANEFVSLWRYDGDSETWSSAGRSSTDSEGNYRFDDVGLGPSPTYAVLEGDGSCARHFSYVRPKGTPFIVADIDGTLTTSDDELFKQIDDVDYDPKEKIAASTMINTWAEKGYLVVYMTARPHIFRAETRAWLDAHGYAQGPLISSNALSFGDTAEAYKSTWVRRLLEDFGWSITAAYGNATSDIEAYAQGGIPKAITFIIGENKGVSDTVPIEDDDYTSHIEDFVKPQKDVN